MASTKLDPQYEKARRLFQQRKYADALALLSTLGPERHPHVLFVRARCLAKLGRKQEALGCCERLRTEFNDSRWKRLAEKLGADPGSFSPCQEERLAPSVTTPKRKTLRRIVVVALVLGVTAGAVGVAAFVRITRSDTTPVITGAPMAADEAVQPIPSAPSTAVQTIAPTVPSPPAFRPDLTLKPEDTAGKLRIRGPGGTELDHADPYDARMDNGFLADGPPDLAGPTSAGRLRLRQSPFDTEGPGGSSEADPKVAQGNLLPSLAVWDAATAAALATVPVTASSILEFQPFKTQQRLTNARGDEVTLTNINPYVGAWYVLEVNGGGKKTALHLEVPSLHDNPLKKPILALYRDGLAVSLEGGVTRQYPLWAAEETVAAAGEHAASVSNELSPAPVLSAVLTPGHLFQSPLTAICDGLILIRAQKPGAATKLEVATELLRETRLGDWFVEKVKPYLIRAPEVGEDHRGVTMAALTQEEVYPLDAQVDESQITLYLTPDNLGIETEAPDRKFYYGRWYRAAQHDHIFVSIMKPTLVDKVIMGSYPDRVGRIGSRDKKRHEEDALVYLIAYDTSQFRFGYALGADHPKLDWSPYTTAVEKKGQGPDGFNSKSPLCTVGAVPPYYMSLVTSTFTGGFKREHGAFKYGPLAKVNNGSHFGFMEQGVIFSRLQPNLATFAIAHDGAIYMFTWPEEGAALLPRITHARQNCVPIIDGRDPNGFSIPGALVNDWGGGGWSANQDGDFVTLRAGVALQEFHGYRFLLFAYFTGATPNAMARVFQAYSCRYAMLLDMNTPSFCYVTLYQHDAEGKIVRAEYLHKDMASGQGGSLKFLQTNDTRDFFYVYQKSQ